MYEIGYQTSGANQMIRTGVLIIYAPPLGVIQTAGFPNLPLRESDAVNPERLRAGAQVQFEIETRDGEVRAVRVMVA